MIIFRYLAKEIVSTMLAVTIILLLIFLCNQFVRYLGLAAAGKLPSLFVFRLMMLEVPNLLALLLPLGLFLGILLAYGRLYADNEMTALTTGGLSWGRFIGMTMTITVIVMLLVAFLVLWLGPKILTDREKLMTEGRNASIIDLITPGRFQVLSEGKKVVYIQSLTRDRKYAEDLFMA
ncbi:MAG: LptF/LptG family permease, partial [Proteobacteria bacterium]|nr:LptF/LptG family permease [Pseudomonadota bacterium]